MSTYDNPVLTIAGVVPGSPQMSQWKTAYHNPDGEIRNRIRRPVASRGPTISMAGIMPGAPAASWNTPYPNGESIYVAALRKAEAKELANKVAALPKARGTHPAVRKAA